MPAGGRPLPPTGGQPPSLAGGGSGQPPSFAAGQMPSFAGGPPPFNGGRPGGPAGQGTLPTGGQNANSGPACSTPSVVPQTASSAPAPSSATVAAAIPAPAASPFLGLTRADAAFSGPAGVSQPPAAPFAGASLFSASTADTFNGWQRAIVTADVQVTDASGNVTIEQAASVDVPARSACGGDGSGSITLSVSNQNQPLGLQLGGSCGSGTGAAPLTFAQPVTLCATLAQYLVTAAHGDSGNGFALVGADGVPLASANVTGAAPSSSQVCGSATATGNYTVGVSVSSAPATPAPSG